ncbi:MAG: exonuclease subunit SbcD [Aquificaceae bacterium]|nr:exonuclease subunit SbcD [Aquificaceae bacterium]
MRVLHISDIHAGKLTYGISRNKDLEYSLNEVLRISKENRVNYIIMSGDIFDRKNPDNTAIEIINEFLVRLKELGIAAIMIGGNHDNFDYLKALKPFGRLTNLFIVDRPKKNLSEAIVELENLCVACLPYPSPDILTEIGEDISKRERKYAELISQYFSALEYYTREKRPRILMSHIFISGAKLGGGELSSSVSPEFSVPAYCIPYGFDYVALGHLHKFQEVEGANSPTYYSGSLYQMDFGESQDSKFVILAEFKNYSPHVEEIEIPVLRNLVSIKLSLEEINDQLFEKFNSSDLYKITLKVKQDEKFTKQVDELKKRLGERLILNLELEKPTKRLENLEYRDKSLESLYELYLKENRMSENEISKYLKTFREIIINEANNS